ncbi:MAG: HD domain-containing protein [Armatimonadetes bacterium]|nr:MAG: HD domain-containing protein [Armatimonadota bacterium]
MSETAAASTRRPVTLGDVKKSPRVRALIDGANEVMKAMGYTEHGHRHAGIVSSITRYLLEQLGAPPREVELGQIAAYLHDIGNVINRESHPISGANLAYPILSDLGMPEEELAPILGAIGNHEELHGTPINTISAALIVADKSDVHYSRVQNPILESFDIHDRVNYAVQKSRTVMDLAAQKIELTLEIDTSYASVMEYFEIFLSRMVMCRKACDTFGYQFVLSVNGTILG